MNNDLLNAAKEIIKHKEKSGIKDYTYQLALFYVESVMSDDDLNEPSLRNDIMTLMEFVKKYGIKMFQMLKFKGFK